MMIRVYLLLAALAAGAGGLWYVQSLRSSNADLTAEVASLEREATVRELAIEQKDEARRVAQAEAERLRVAAAEYDSIREWVLRSDDNAPIPPLLRDALDRLLRRAPR